MQDHPHGKLSHHQVGVLEYSMPSSRVSGTLGSVIGWWREREREGEREGKRIVEKIAQERMKIYIYRERAT